MSPVRYSACLIGIALISGCGTPDHYAWATGVRQTDAREIGDFIVARSLGQVAYYSRETDGSVAVWMRPGHDSKFGDIGRGHRPFHAYVVRRLAARWEIVDEHVMVGGDG
jgi:hypothetical protein